MDLSHTVPGVFELSRECSKYGLFDTKKFGSAAGRFHFTLHTFREMQILRIAVQHVYDVNGKWSMDSMRALFAMAAASAMIFSTPSRAATQWCTGSIDHMFVEANGLLQVIPSWRGDWVAICSTAVVWKGVPTETCKTWQAVVLTAITTRVNTVIHYADAPACAQIPQYANAPAVGYIGISVQ